MFMNFERPSLLGLYIHCCRGEIPFHVIGRKYTEGTNSRPHVYNTLSVHVHRQILEDLVFWVWLFTAAWKSFGFCECLVNHQCVCYHASSYITSFIPHKWGVIGFVYGVFKILILWLLLKTLRSKVLVWFFDHHSLPGFLMMMMSSFISSMRQDDLSI